MDPFSVIYKRIIAILQADATLSELVRDANWITFDSKVTPWKKNLQPGDAPEILVEPVTGMDQFASTSTSGETQVTWSIKVATNDTRLFYDDVSGNSSGIFPLHWALMVCLDKAGDNLKLNGDAGLSFVRSTRLTATVKSPFDPVGNPISEGRGTDGWTLLATLTTVIDVPRKADGTLDMGFVTSGGNQVTTGGTVVTSP